MLPNRHRTPPNTHRDPAAPGGVSSDNAALLGLMHELLQSYREQSAHIAEIRSWMYTHKIGQLLLSPAQNDEQVIACIRCGADLHYNDVHLMGYSVLHTLAFRGLVEPLHVALMEREDAIDLSLGDFERNSLLHTILLCNCPDEKVDKMLKIVRARLGKFGVSTTVDWEQKNAAGEDVVNAAARRGRLHLFWKHFESHNYWDDKMPGEIALWVTPQREDWNLLGVQNQRYFRGEGVDVIEECLRYTDWPPADPTSLHAEQAGSTPTLRFDGAVGMDLGTTNCCVAVWQNEMVKVIPNKSGYRTTPSYVSFTEKGLLIGEAAKNHASMNASNTVWDVLRLLGRGFTDPVVQAGLKRWLFKVVEGQDGKALIQVEFMGERRDFTPEEVCSMILFHLKEIAENYLGKQVEKVVLTMPAYFSFAQRAALHRAAKRAGLDALRIITASTAVSITYGMGIVEGPERNALVVDLGGHSCNVTLMTVNGGIFDVKAVSGEHSLGGEDIDSLLVDFFIEEFKKKNKGKDLSSSPRALRRLRTACEQAKCTLSSATEVMVPIDALYDSVDFNLILTRSQFETLCGKLLSKVVPVVERVLKDGRIPKHAVHHVVVVGGCSRIPVLQRLLSDYFDGKPLNQCVNADEAAACGAAVQAIIVTGGASTRTKSLLLSDVTSLSLGVEIAGGVMSVLAKKNAMIPTVKSVIFTTCVDNQSSARICVFEGEGTMTKDCCFLVAFEITCIPAAPRGKPRIEVTFRVNEQGTLDVSAKVNGIPEPRSGITISYDDFTGRCGMNDMGGNSKNLWIMIENRN